MDDLKAVETRAIVAALLEDYKKDRVIDHNELHNQPDTDIIYDILEKLIKIVYPGFYKEKAFHAFNIASSVSALIEDVYYNLDHQIRLALRQDPVLARESDEAVENRSREIVQAFFNRLPVVREYLQTDVEAAFDGDPAAYNHNEIILAYPGFYAITVSRLAHELYLMKVPLIPRIMTEFAHSKTGIDIHPGTTIGKYFFIDHGTGTVIGETAVIGEHVKIYQGVTIGALSTRYGQKRKGTKRHPTLEDYVTIYSGATVLGGETVIGRNAVIGGNAFITSSIPADARVAIKVQELSIKTGDRSTLKQDDSWDYVL